MLKLLAVAAVLVPLVIALEAGQPTKRISVEGGTDLEFVQVVPQKATFKEHKALRLVQTPHPTREGVALVNGVEFENGTIEVDVAGLPGTDSGEGARGFVGIAFRSAAHAEAFECFYIRPTNGRADDQLRRNHSTQYVSEPQFPWQKLRAENPGVYESYVDLEIGVWTHLRLDVDGVRARLFVNGAPQPTLIVNDLKRGVVSGQVGLWIGSGTEAYFRNLQISSR
jgi:3-keto-disaccharide hydrolase